MSAQTVTIMPVCTGNICRSAMAEVVLRSLVDRRGLADRIQVSSSAVSNEEQGNPMDPRAVQVLHARGYAPSPTHRAHQITRRELESSDLLLPMTLGHYRALSRMVSAGDMARVRMYRWFDPALASMKAEPSAQFDLEDPWYGTLRDFEVALDQIEAAADSIVDWAQDQLER